jgi:hypothetical protein
MKSGTVLKEAKIVDFGGAAAQKLHSVNTGNASGAQPFRIAVQTTSGSGSDATEDEDIRDALRWSFAVTPLVHGSLDYGIPFFRLRRAADFDDTLSWHQIYHPIACMSAILLYLSSYSGRKLHVSSWTYGNKSHVQVQAKAHEIHALTASDTTHAAELAAAKAIAKGICDRLADNSPHTLVSLLCNLLSSTKKNVTHGLGMVASYGDQTPLVSWPRLCGLETRLQPQLEGKDMLQVDVSWHRIHTRYRSPYA